MAKVIGFLSAFMALAAGLIAGTDPITNLERAGIAAFVGWAAGTIWQALMVSTSVVFSAKTENMEESGDNTGGEKQEAA